MMNTERLRDHCLSLPAVTEAMKWDVDLCFSIGGKMFCVLDTSPGFSVAFKVTDEEYESLSTSQDIIPAPYMARIKWIQVKNGTRFTEAEWIHYLQQSYDLVKAKLTKKVRDSLGA
jgi:predicted DNA-binding protein (MmcQ/YjbR family)